MHRFTGSSPAPAALVLAGACLSVPALSAPPNSQTGDEQIEQIVVVAHRDKRSIRDIAANVSALSRADMKAQLATSLSDLFQFVPGIDYEGAGTRFGAEGISIRGIGGNRVAILVDGVPLSDHFNTGSLQCDS